MSSALVIWLNSSTLCPACNRPLLQTEIGWYPQAPVLSTGSSCEHRQTQVLLCTALCHLAEQQHPWFYDGQMLRHRYAVPEDGEQPSCVT